MASLAGMNMGNLGSGVSTQLAVVGSIPMQTLEKWPGYITFGIIDYAQGIVASALPNMGGGVTGTIYNSAVRGFFKTLQFVTWDAIKAAY